MQGTGVGGDGFLNLQRRYFLKFKEPRNQFHGIDSASLIIYSLAGRYDNPIPTRFLALIDCSKIPALPSASEGHGGIKRTRP
jgi:hypothetical protein